MSPQHKSRWPVVTSALSFVKFLKSTLCMLGSSESETPFHGSSNSNHPGHVLISRPHNLRRFPPPSKAPETIHFINRLPVEIISLIFVLGSQEDIHFPITISHVCSRWREIALHTPQLWRRIALGPAESIWREHIQRSRACSLDVQLLSSRVTRAGFHRSQDLDPYSVHWYMQMVLPHIRRWRSLEIDITDHSPYLWKSALAGCSVPAPLLEELSLTYRLNDDPREFFLFAGFSPHLKRLKVDGIRLAYIPSLFGNLTSLDYTHHGFTTGHQAVIDIISILTVTTRLTSFRLLFPRGRRACASSHQNVASQRVVLPSLQLLVLQVDGPDIPFEIAHFAFLVSTPALSDLRLVDLRRASQPFQSLKSFFYIYPLPPSLRFVSLGHAWYDSRMIHALIHSLPRLYKISIKRSSTPEQVLNLRPQTRRVYRSTKRMEGHNSDGRYLIDHFNVQYIPTYGK